MAEYKHQLLYWYLFSFFVFFCVLHHIQIQMGTQIAQKNTIKIAQRAGCGFSRIPHAAAPFVPKGSLCCQSLVAFFFERAGLGYGLAVGCVSSRSRLHMLIAAAEPPRMGRRRRRRGFEAIFGTPSRTAMPPRRKADEVDERTFITTDNPTRGRIGLPRG